MKIVDVEFPYIKCPCGKLFPIRTLNTKWPRYCDPRCKARPKKKRHTRPPEQVRRHAKLYRERHPEYMRQYRRRHRKEIRLQRKRYIEQHREELREKQKRYRLEHLERIKAREKHFRETHREQLLAKNRRYRASNLEKFRVYDSITYQIGATRGKPQDLIEAAKALYELRRVIRDRVQLK